MRQRFRLFVWSHGDVMVERRRVEKVASRLNGEFAGVARLQPIRWETENYQAFSTFQSQIPPSVQCDLVIGILKWRLGTELPPDFEEKLPGGKAYPSGAAYEILTAIDKRQKGGELLDVYVFRFAGSSPSAALDDPNRDTEQGHFKVAFNPYDSEDDFESQLERLLRKLLADKVAGGRALRWPTEVKGSPFRGLDAFGAKHAPVFFGRAERPCLGPSPRDRRAFRPVSIELSRRARQRALIMRGKSTFPCLDNATEARLELGLSVKARSRDFAMAPIFKWVSRFALLLAVIFATMALAPVEAATRRAFVVGVQKYGDPGLQPLLRPANDANDFAKDLEDVGFAHENIKVATAFRTKAEFQKTLGDFLNGVKPGDEVLFFFSGHGFASSDKNDVNYLLFGGTRSLLTFTRDRLAKSTDKQDVEQSKDAAAVRLRQKDFEINYEVEEIKSVGISVEDVQNQIMAKSPARLLMFLDACRTLALSGSELPGAAPMTGLHTRTPDWLKDGVAILYSASEGQAAIENMDFFDQRRNALFTDVLRLNIARPGVELRRLAEQVSAQVDEVAFTRTGLHQKPEFVEKQAGDFRFVPSIGAERFPLPPEAQPCFGSQKDFEDAKAADDAPEDRLITHVEIFAQCPSADEARAELSRLREVSGHFTHPAGDCDDLAASPYDVSLRGKPGVPFERIGRLDPPRDHIQQVGEPDEFDTKYVVDVCAEAVKANPRVSRYALNLARAEHANALNRRVDAQTRRESLERAKFDYERLAEAGEALAMNNLAQFYDYGGDSGLKDSERRWIDPQKALELWGKAAQQGLPVAQYNLALKYRFGWTAAGLKMDLGEFRHWMGLAARAGSVAAIVWEADSEKLGIGNEDGEKNPALAVELLKRAARMGSVEAERRLGYLELDGAVGGAQSTLATAAKAGEAAPSASMDAKGVLPDPQEALIWFGRAAAHGDATSNYVLSRLLEIGRGVSEPEPAIASRYLRAAAEAGFASAQVEYVDKIVDGELMLRFDDRDQVIDRLLKRAMAQKVDRGPTTESGAAERTRELGNGRAALLLAERAWPTEAGAPRNAKLAAAYAFEAIDLAAQANPAVHYFQNDFSPLTEIAAGQFLVMLAHEPDCVDEFGKPLFSKAEIDTLEKYYGVYDDKQRRVVVKIIDMYDYSNYFPQTSAERLPLWIWDWGRAEAPTEQQFRRIELWRDTTFFDLYRDRYLARKRNDPNAMHAHPEYVTQNMLRSSLSDIYNISRNIKTSFLDLLANKLDLISKKE